MTLDGLIDRMGSLQGQMNAFARASLEERRDDVLALQREQLFSGTDRNGQDIRPYYSEDLKSRGGYFNTPQAAQRYAQWKAGMTYPSGAARNADAPNLYINGRFHSEIGVEFSDDSMLIKGDTAYAVQIIGKYEAAFGLSETSMGKLKPLLTEKIVELMKSYIYG